MTAAFGVNNESTGAIFNRWGQHTQGWGTDLQAIVSFVDKYSIKITLSNSVAFVDEDDRLGPTSGNPSQRQQAVVALNGAGVDKGTIAVVLNNLKAALENQSSSYDLQKVIGLLKTKGLALELIKSLGKQGDELIKELLTKLGENPENFLKAPPASSQPTESQPPAPPQPQPQTQTSPPQPAPPAPSRATPAGKKALTVNGVNGAIFTIEWVDADSDGKVDLSERESAVIVIGNQELGKLNEKFALLVDRGMDAQALLGDSEITEEEFKEAAAVVAQYAKALGMGFKDALRAYNESVSFRRVSVRELEDARTEISGWLNGVTLYNNGTLNEQAVKDALKGKGLTEALIDNVIAYLKSKQGATVDDAAAYLLRCAMASMTGLYNIFGVDQNSLANMRLFDPRTVTKEKLVKWLQGQDISENTTGGSSTDQKIRTYQELQTASDKVTFFNSHRELADFQPALELMANHYIDNNDIDKALEFINKLTDNAKKAELLKKLTDKATTRDNLNKIVSAAKLLPDSLKQEVLASVVLAALRSNNPEIRNHTFIDPLVTQINDNTSVQTNNGSITGRQLKDYANERLATHVDILNARDLVFVSNGEQERVKESADFPKAIEALNSIINDSNSKYSDEDKTRARFTLAEVYAARAQNTTNTKPLEALRDYYEAQTLLKKIWDDARQPNAPAYLSDLCNRAVQKMAQVALAAKGLKSTSGQISINNHNRSASWVFGEIKKMIPDDAQIPLQNGGTISGKDFKRQLGGGGSGGGSRRRENGETQADI